MAKVFLFHLLVLILCQQSILLSSSQVQDILIMQPLKIFCMALFIALIVKKLEDEEKSEVEKAARHLAKDENWLTTSAHDTTIFDRVEVTEMKPPDLSKLDWMRELRIKETQMYAITREITLYIFFTIVVFFVGYLTRDTIAYHQTRDIEELLFLKPRAVKNISVKKDFRKARSFIAS